jgi:LEA14-like dessication related protein
VDYALASEGESFLSGSADLQGSVPAGGRSVLALPAKLKYAEVLKALSGVRPGGVVPYAAEMGLSVDVPMGGPLRLPIRKEGQLPVPAAPEVKVASIQWDELGLDRAGGRVRVEFVNRNDFPLDLSKMEYALSLAGREVARSSIAKAVAMKGSGGAGAVEIPISFSPRDLGAAVLAILMGQKSAYTLAGNLVATTPYGKIEMPVREAGEAPLGR